ncbi:hypothetical protein GUITHDRAFT_104589 [Guillardia theta CCMP2712]|uniref:Uncharacterized protein n=1 Tax=Guillardia theta (strain CCMP2712) TaxID=905079 RepID=L1JNH0_GUITC|nr:hypothetical protein GUITHDRAFT_104588 [Guillardia theta CCMP2712]XP_005836609.1 hypothetical protein GUITHDRAFT_104589 [Guillardia theta CCMP2712]EKX49628.1 hypothetical protein GUITHDRAFT_104588 [Guillardia theta CCMP2712]EKX49629.1 hypothetical protein GUITHDRAFT_104589 [Guillardia theta CCMP2712]|eukprot:XP_005836608.1 hypothetical protein GUITHDRAFT_104588 [Guillardia theta CCMP2712]
MIATSLRQQVRRKDVFISMTKFAFSVSPDSCGAAASQASMHCLVKVESDGSDCLKNILDAKRKDPVPHDGQVGSSRAAQGHLKTVTSAGSSTLRIASE